MMEDKIVEEFPTLDNSDYSSKLSNIVSMLNKANPKLSNKVKDEIKQEVIKLLKEERSEAMLKMKIIQLESEKKVLEYKNMVLLSKQNNNSQNHKKDPIKHDEEVIIVEPKKGIKMCNDEINKLVNDNLNVTVNGFQINSIKQSKKNKIIISTNKDQVNMITNKLKDTINEKCVIRQPAVIEPQIILKNISKEMNRDQIANAIIAH